MKPFRLRFGHPDKYNVRKLRIKKDFISGSKSQYY